MDDKINDNNKQSVNIETIFSHAFWLEKYNNEKKFQSSIFENYLPNMKKEILAPKFYSKYCKMDTSNEDYQNFLKIIENSYQNMTMEKGGHTVCQNQEYGWLIEPFTKLDVKDRMRLMKPRGKTELSHFAEKLEEQKITSRPTFNGLLFKL